MGTNNDDNGVSTPDGSIVSADGSVLSLGRRVTSTSAEIVLLPNLMKLPDIFFASAYGMIIPLPKTNALSYAEITLVYRNLFSAGKEITWKYGKLVPEEGSIISTHGILASPYGDMNKKPIFIVPAYAEIDLPYKRTISLPNASCKSCAAKTSTYSKTKRNFIKTSCAYKASYNGLGSSLTTTATRILNPPL